jgi:hypothetical protein
VRIEKPGVDVFRPVFLMRLLAIEAIIPFDSHDFLFCVGLMAIFLQNFNLLLTVY